MSPPSDDMLDRRKESDPLLVEYSAFPPDCATLPSIDDPVITADAVWLKNRPPPKREARPWFTWVLYKEKFADIQIAPPEPTTEAFAIVTVDSRVYPPRDATAPPPPVSPFGSTAPPLADWSEMLEFSMVHANRSTSPAS